MRKISELTGPGNAPAEEPQAKSDREQLQKDYTVAPDKGAKMYYWCMTAEHCYVDDEHNLREMLTALGLHDETRPHAYGKMYLHYRWSAEWDVLMSNMSLHLVLQRAKKYSRDNGWKFISLNDEGGNPFDVYKTTAKTAGMRNWLRKLLMTPELQEEMAPAKLPGEDWSQYDPLYVPEDWTQQYQTKPPFQFTPYVKPEEPPPGRPEDLTFSVTKVGSQPDQLVLDPEMATWKINAISQGKVVGWVNVGQPPWAEGKFVYFNLGVLPNYRRRGIATELVDLAFKEFPTADHDTAYSDQGGAFMKAVYPEVPMEEGEPDEQGRYGPFNPEFKRGRVASDPGMGEHNPGLKDWRETELSDARNDNVDYYGEQNYRDDEPAPGPRTCSECHMPFPNYESWRQHVEHEHINPGRLPSAAPRPVVDYDNINPPKFNITEMDKTVQRQAASDQQVFGPLPFIFDIEKDRIYVGHPGERHSDIPGKFTPGGIIEGLYKPDKKVQIKTDTDMPYTVRHMIQLWYAMHPELQVKGVELLVGSKKYRLASRHIQYKLPTHGVNGQTITVTFEGMRRVYQWFDDEAL